jgi:hypothetical protein
VRESVSVRARERERVSERERERGRETERERERERCVAEIGWVHAKWFSKCSEGKIIRAGVGMNSNGIITPPPLNRV